MPHEVSHPDHERYMRHCFELARRGLGHTRSNPVVGALLEHYDRVIGEGWHRQWGMPHAEVECLESVAPEDKALIPESTLYVSLEPCAHWGKQPPCAERIVREGIRRVVVSVDDPNPRVDGRGYQVLEDAGVEVMRGVLRDESRWLTRRFLSLHEQRRPYVILKWAQSADGFIAPPQGQRVMMSSAISQRLVHKWRAEEDAILVGYRTALLDNPRLTARLWDGPQPLRIVLDRDATLPASLQLFDNEAPTWWASEKGVGSAPSHVRTLQTSFDKNIFSSLLNELKIASYSSIIVEGGAATLTEIISAGLWDEARIVHTPVVLGDGIRAPQLRDAQPAFSNRVDLHDLLTVYTRTGSTYSYPAHAEL